MKDIILTLFILGNIYNFIYNIPFVYVVYKNWCADNISNKFLLLRIIGALIWIGYSIIIKDFFIGLSYTVTLLSSTFVCYVKITNTDINPIKSLTTSPKFIYKNTIV